MPSLNIQPLSVDSNTVKFDLTLSLTQTTQGLDGTFEYNTDLFDDTSITRMVGHFQTLLEGIVSQPQQRIAQLSLLTKQEQQQLLLEWNNTQTNYPQHKCIHQLIEEQVLRTPDSVAVVFEGHELTYRELNARANQLAHYLQTLGVKPETLVGICVERSLEMIVGILGILKAGGAYVPLDPTYPQQRLAFMLEDAQVLVLLTQKNLLKQLPKHNTHIFCLDNDWKFVSQNSEENLICKVNPDNLAYVIYTSGSTGRPKGTLIIHRGFVNYLSWCIKAYKVADGFGAPVNSSIGFDATITSLFSPLLVGKKVVLLPKEEEIESLKNALCSQNNFSLVKITPAHLDILSQLLPTEQLESQTRALIIGGETLSGESLRFWRTYTSNTRIINEYGPTETVVGCCVYEVTDQTYLTGKIPIGRPIANTQLYILDNYLQPVPINVVGELYIGGAGVARGYLNRSDLTNEKFITSPFDPEKRLYKTGDLARYLCDGNIEFIGRIDYQVKIRGFRIELGEIEAVIAQHQSVQTAVVIDREDQLGKKRLVAYIVQNLKQALSLDEQTLTKYLRNKLPNYMVPNAFVFLDKLPLTPNGKIDRQTLPDHKLTRLQREKTFVPPRTSVENILAKIWAELLRLDHVGINDNFFELGGDSILSIQAIARAKQAGLQLTAKQMFEHQAIAQLAAVAGTITQPEAEQGLVTGEVPLTPIQHWFFQQNFPYPHHWNQSVLLEAQQQLDPQLLATAIQHLLKHHDALRLRYEQTEFGWRQFITSADNSQLFTHIDLSAVAEALQAQAIETTATEIQASLKLCQGPLVRVALLELGSQKGQRLLVVIHHLAVDGVSWRILLEDLQTAYHQLSQGKLVKLPAKTTSFQQWARLLQDYAVSKTLQQELDHWLSLSSATVSPLPVDYPGGNNTIADSHTISVHLTEAETTALLTEVPATYNTQIIDVLLTALVQALTPWMRSSTLLVNLEGHGREEIFNHVDLSRTVGWFTSEFPVLLSLEKVSQPPGDALKTIKEQLRRIPNRGIGYGILRYLH
ncbi:MAG: amino acid adenylation domain-containing protein, partial [Hassallia sp.]